MQCVRPVMAIPLFALLAATCFIAGWLIGQGELAAKGDAATAASRLEINRNWAQFPEVQDALARYRRQKGKEFDGSMDHREIQIMQLRDRYCIQLQLALGSVGGTPVWCYAGQFGRQHKPVLVYDGSVVE
jgi:hypothetical protein